LKRAGKPGPYEPVHGCLWAATHRFLHVRADGATHSVSERMAPRLEDVKPVGRATNVDPTFLDLYEREFRACRAR